jgi:hypothetical protein
MEPKRAARTGLPDPSCPVAGSQRPTAPRPDCRLRPGCLPPVSRTTAGRNAVAAMPDAIPVVICSVSFFGLPVLLVYGILRGLEQSTPDVIVPQFVGALFGRYCF